MIKAIADAIGNFFGWKESANDALLIKEDIKEGRISKKAIYEAVKLIREMDEYIPKEARRKYNYRKKRFFNYIAKD